MLLSSHTMHLNMQWTRFARRLRWVSHPITVFVTLQCVWLAITIIWVIWFLSEQAQIALLAQKFGTQYFDTSTTIGILVAGCVLLGMLLFGTITLFVFGQRQTSAVRQQRNFVSSVTHELKSPLASLQLGFETLAARTLAEDVKARIMDMIFSDIERLRRLVDQILVAGSIDRGMLSFDEENTVFGLEDLVDRICSKLSYQDREVRQRVFVDAPSGPQPRFFAAALNLVLSNLIENAVKYSPRGTPIVVGLGYAKGDVLFSVKDRGLGLDKKDQRKIFKMFHRSDFAVKKAIPGTGLGLYIVKSAVQRLGGKVWVESAGRDQGTTFFVSLPAPAVIAPAQGG
jgi:signal transduction histidine kinase